MANSVNTVFEVRPDGNDANGGGFISTATGTDYTQQAAAQIAYTDMVIGTPNTTFTSVGNSPAATLVGNTINVTAGTGFTVQRVQVTSVAGGVATCDKALGTIGSTGGTGNMGGAFATIGNCGVAAVGLASGHNIYIKATGIAHSITSATINVSGGTLSNTLQCMMVGYTSTRTVTNTDAKPLIQYNVSTATLFAGRMIVRNLEVDGNAQTAAKLSGSVDYFQNCKFENFNTASVAGGFVGCYATTCSANIFTGNCVSCEAHACTATPFKVIMAAHCIATSNTGASTDSFDISNVSAIAVNCISYAPGRDGFAFVSTGRPSVAVNCHSENAGAYGFNVSTLPAQALVNCSHYNSTTAGVNSTGNILNSGAIPVTAGSVFTNAAAFDFSLNNTANQGALLRGLGYPALFPRGTTANYMDIGASQHQDSGGGTTTIFNIME